MSKRKKLIPVFLVILIMSGLPSLIACAKKPKPTPAQVVDEQVRATRQAIDRYVDDEQRAAGLLELLAEVEEVLLDYNRGLEERVSEFQAAYNDYGSSREDLEELIEEIKASTRLTRGSVVDIHFRMRDLTTEDEWKRIVKYEADAIRASRPGVQ